MESPESIEEMEIIGKHFHKPLFANMVEGGRTPVLDKKTLKEFGYSIAIFPVLGFLAAANAICDAFAQLKTNGSSNTVKTPLYPFEEFSALMGFDEVTAFDERYGEIA